MSLDLEQSLLKMVANGCIKSDLHDEMASEPPVWKYYRQESKIWQVIIDIGVI